MDPKSINSLTLAYLGDAEYELFVRTRIILHSPASHANALHKAAIKYVCAAAQASIVKTMMEEGFLSEDEIAVVKRGRNHRTTTKAKNADPVDYKWATAFEALLGWLKLEGKRDRLTAVMERACEIAEGKHERKE